VTEEMQMNRKVLSILMTALLVPAFGCAATLEPPQDPAIEPDKQYLVEKGPSPTLDLVAPDRSVLEALRQLEEDKAALVREAGHMHARLDELTRQSERQARDLEQEKTARAGAEAERDDARRKLGEQQSRLLSVAIERARFEHELLELRIAALEKKKTQGPAKVGREDPWGAAAAPPQGDK
jgi:hypothetical protein